MLYRLRAATLDDVATLEALIARSARQLSAGDYAPEQVEGALRGTFGVDTQLIKDGTYFVAESEDTIAACGGWSYRRTLFGSDSGTQRDASELDPTVDAAKIRAFFVDPSHARKGIGTLLLEQCESAAHFTRVPPRRADGNLAWPEALRSPWVRQHRPHHSRGRSGPHDRFRPDE